MKINLSKQELKDIVIAIEDWESEDRILMERLNKITKKLKTYSTSTKIESFADKTKRYIKE